MDNSLKIIRTRFDEKGDLSFFEANKDIPFDIRRIYYITNVRKDETRGFHAHKNLEQFLFCPYGKIGILLDDGKTEKNFILDSPEKGLIVGKGIWRTMKFIGENSVLCVAASDFYDEDDYIRDYNEFLKLVRDGYWK